MYTQRSISRINIAKLILQQTGTYNTVHSRPYETHLNGMELNNVLTRVRDASLGKVTGLMLAGALGGMVEPSAAPGQQVGISQGWQTVRGRFVMEVHVTFNTGSYVIYYFQGYTDHLGVSLHGSIDPNMVFIINSFMTVSRVNQLTPIGMTTRDIVVETGHLLTNDSYQGPYSGASQYLMRPQDVFRGINVGYMGAAENNYDMPMVTDTSSMLKRDPSKSSRSNNLPTNYVAKIIDGYQHGVALSEYGQSTHDIYEHSRQQVYEAHAAENPFIRAISDMRSNGVSNRFTFTDLELIDSNARNVTNLIQLAPHQMQHLHQAGSTAYWTGTDRETVVSTILSHSVPALMMEMMISKVHIFSHNHDVTGAIDTKLVGPIGLSNADMTQQFELFKQRFDREVMYNITFGNQERYTLDMRVDLFGDTWINLSLGNNPQIMFNTPSFADGLFTPVIANNSNQFNNVVHDFETLLNNVTDVSSTRNMAVSNLI